MCMCPFTPETDSLSIENMVSSIQNLCGTYSWFPFVHNRVRFDAGMFESTAHRIVYRFPKSTPSHDRCTLTSDPTVWQL